MAANPKCKVEIMHSARGLQVLTMSWSDFAWRMFGGNSQVLKPIYESLKSTKVATYKDDSGTLTIKAIDNVDI